MAQFDIYPNSGTGARTTLSSSTYSPVCWTIWKPAS